MDNKLLLVRIITLLYIESHLNKKGNSNSRVIVRDALSYIKAPDAAVIADLSKDSTAKLRDVAMWLLDLPTTVEVDQVDLLNRCRIATAEEEYIFESINANIGGIIDEEEMKRIGARERDEINIFINRALVMGVIKEAYQISHFKPDAVDWSAFVKDTMNKLDPYKNLAEKDQSTLVESIDLTNPEALAASFKSSLSEINPEGIIKFGWQGFNRMFGEQGGGRRGEFIVLGALQHNFKSGTSLEMLKAAALYNRPWMMDPSKKPLLIRYSFENPVIVDIMHIYKSLVEAETQMLIDTNMIDPIVAAIYVSEKLAVNGYKVQLIHHNPSDFTYSKLFDDIESWENKGFEVHMVNLDYLAMISTKGCKQGATGQDIRDLFRRVRNFMAAKNILCLTPHQLSVDAKKKTRDGVEDFVREIANKGYWDSCSTIDQEVDMEIYQHLVVINGETYVTWMRGKHRKAGTPTPHEHYYTVYKFAQVGFIPDDVLGNDMSRKRVAAATAAEGGQTAWFDMAA